MYGINFWFGNLRVRNCLGNRCNISPLKTGGEGGTLLYKRRTILFALNIPRLRKMVGGSQLGCDALLSGGSSLTFRRKLLLPSSGFESRSGKQQLLLEDGVTTFFRKGV